MFLVLHPLLVRVLEFGKLNGCCVAFPWTSGCLRCGLGRENGLSSIGFLERGALQEEGRVAAYRGYSGGITRGHVRLPYGGGVLVGTCFEVRRLLTALRPHVVISVLFGS